MKALRVLESKWNPIRQKLVRRLLEEQDKVLRSYFAQKGEGGREFKEGESLTTKVGSMSSGTCTCEARTEGKGVKPRCMIKGSARDEWGRSF